MKKIDRAFQRTEEKMLLSHRCCKTSYGKSPYKIQFCRKKSPQQELTGVFSYVIDIGEILS